MAVDDAATLVKRIVAGMEKFAEEMRAQGIHVGVGARDPRCVTCGKPWPCPAAEERPR